MAAFSTYLANALGNESLRATAWTAPATVYLALHTADPTVAGTGTEVTGGSYARQSVAFDALALGVTANTALITFPTSTANWGTVTHWAIRDALTGGNMLYFGALTAQKVMTSGDIFTVPAGNFDLVLA